MRREQVLTVMLWIGAVFLIANALFHFSGVRLSGVSDWPDSSRSFATFFMWLWGSFALFMAAVLVQMARFPRLRRNLAMPVAAWAMFHAIVLFWWSMQSVVTVWGVPSLYVWTELYPWISRAEATSLLVFAGLLLWERSTSAASNSDGTARVKPRTKFSS